MKRISGRCKIVGLAAALLLAGAAAAGAQTSDGSTTLRKLAGAIVFTGQIGTTAPPGSENIGITLSGVSLTNALPQMKAANDAYVARLTRGRIPVSELFDATADLQSEYQNAGYVLVRILLPKQSLRDGGRLRVSVVKGAIQSVDTASAPPQIESRIKQLTKGLVGRPDVTASELERQLSFAGDIPGTALSASLSQGSSPGAAVIELKPQFRPVTGFVGVANPYADDIHNPELSFGVEINSPDGLGESFYLRLTGAPIDSLEPNLRSRTGTLGATFPLGASGAIFNYELTKTRSKPDDLDPTEYTSSYTRHSLRVIYPLVRSQKVRATAQFALDLVEDKQEEFYACCGGYTYSAVDFLDRLRVARVGLSATRDAADGSVTDGNLMLSRGLDVLGARTLKDVIKDFYYPPLSRGDADAIFTKLSGSISHRRPLTDNLNLVVDGQFQTSFNKPLVTSEQFNLTGAHALSTFDSGSLRGDNGWVLRAELATTVSLKIPNVPLTASPYIFAGHGEETLEATPDYFVYSAVKTTASSYGVGMDLFAKHSRFRSSSVRIEYGRGVRNDGVPDGNRFSFTGTFRF